MAPSNLHDPTTDPDTSPSPNLFQPLSTTGLIDRYAAGTQLIERRLLDLDDEQADTYFRPEAGVGQWSCRALVGHLADAEVVLVHRMRRTLAEDQPLLTIWDEDAFIDAQLYTARAGRIAGFIATIHTLRLWTSEWLRSLDPPSWERVALHPEAGEQSLRDQLVKTTWHFEHHIWFLRRKLQLLLASAE